MRRGPDVDCGRTLIPVYLAVSAPDNATLPRSAYLRLICGDAKSASSSAMRVGGGRVPHPVVLHLGVADRPPPKRQIDKSAGHDQQPQAVEERYAHGAARTLAPAQGSAVEATLPAQGIPAQQRTDAQVSGDDGDEAAPSAGDRRRNRRTSNHDRYRQLADIRYEIKTGRHRQPAAGHNRRSMFECTAEGSFGPSKPLTPEAVGSPYRLFPHLRVESPGNALAGHGGNATREVDVFGQDHAPAIRLRKQIAPDHNA